MITILLNDTMSGGTSTASVYAFPVDAILVSIDMDYRVYATTDNVTALAELTLAGAGIPGVTGQETQSLVAISSVSALNYVGGSYSVNVSKQIAVGSKVQAGQVATLRVTSPAGSTVSAYAYIRMIPSGPAQYKLPRGLFA